jgi:hypothetical protein
MAQPRYKSVTQLFRESSAAVQRNLGLFLLLNVLTILSIAWQTGSDLKDKTHGSGWGDIVRNTIFGHGSNSPHWGGGLSVLLLFLAGMVLWLMNTILTVRAAQGKTVELSEVWREFKIKWLRLLAVTILSGIMIILGFVLLIVPGILILPRLVLAPYLLVDQNTGVREAISRSWHLSKGKMDPIYMVLLFSLVLSIPSIVPIVGPIVGFALGLAYSAALPMRYFEIKKAGK